MLDGIQHISSEEAKAKCGEMRLIIAAAIISRTDTTSLLTSLQTIAGDDMEGPAVWGQYTPFTNAQSILGRWEAGMLTSKEALMSLSETIAA